jgi:transcriptional regulator with XRE-family HTH domain
LVSFGTKVRLARRKSGLTQRELGEAAGLAQSYIFEIETMGANVSLEGLARLASCLRVSIKDLIPDNEFDTVTPSNLSVFFSTLDRVAEILAQAANLLSEASFTELRERLERLAKNEPES